MAEAKLSTDSRPLTQAGLTAWKRFLRANSRLTQELDRELRDRHGYPLGDFDVLAQLAEAGSEGLRMCDLAEAVVLSPSGLSRRVDRLEQAGLVSRRRGQSDARNVVARLTAAGRRKLQRLRTTHREGVLERFTSAFSDDELETLAELLGRIAADGEGSA